MQAVGYGSLGTFPIFVVFIAIGVHYQIPALTIFWSVFLGALLTAAIGLILKAHKE